MIHGTDCRDVFDVFSALAGGQDSWLRQNVSFSSRPVGSCLSRSPLLHFWVVNQHICSSRMFPPITLATVLPKIIKTSLRSHMWIMALEYRSESDGKIFRFTSIDARRFYEKRNQVKNLYKMNFRPRRTRINLNSRKRLN